MASASKPGPPTDDELALLSLLSDPDEAPRSPSLAPAPHQDGWYPATETQRRLWLNGFRCPDDRHGHLAIALTFQGPVDHAVLRRSLEAVVRDQRILSVRFRWKDSRLEASPTDPLPVEEHSEEAWTDLSVVPLPLDGPLFKADFFGRAPLTVLLRTHHLVTDGMGIRILLSTWSAHYRAEAAKADPPRPPRLSFLDFAAAEHGHAPPEDALEAWDRELEGASPRLALPVDHARPFSFEARWSEIEWTETLTAAIRALAREAHCTLFMAIAGIYQMMLSLAASELDVTVGTTVSQRDRPETEPLVGNFGRNLLIRTVLEDRRSLLENLERAREAVLAAQRRSSVSIEAWHAHRLARGRLDPPPDFQCVLLLRPAPYDRYLEMGQPVLEHPPLVRTITPDLLVDLIDGGDRIRGVFEARADRFESAEPWVRALTATAEAVVASKNEDLGALRARLAPKLLGLLGSHQPVRWAWTKVLGHDRFSDRDSFFDVGGTSWRAARLGHLLQTKLGRPVPRHWLYESPTIESMALRLSQHDAE